MRFFPMTHSIPDSQALVLRTPYAIEYVSLCYFRILPTYLFTFSLALALLHGLSCSCSHGAIFHTGDWKFDDNPLIGAPPDYEALKRYEPHIHLPLHLKSKQIHAAYILGVACSLLHTRMLQDIRI